MNAKILWNGAFALLLVLVFAVPTVSSAQDKPAQSGVAVKVAVIDIDAVRREAKAVNGIREQIIKFRETFQKGIDADEKDLRARQQEVVRQRSILSPEAFDAERDKFNRHVASVKKKIAQKQQALQSAEARAMQKVQIALNEVIAAMAKEENLTLLLRKDQTVLVARPLDITPHVIARLDKALSSVTVTLDAPAK